MLQASLLNISAVALFTRAWIEIADKMIIEMQKASRPLHEGVD